MKHKIFKTVKSLYIVGTGLEPCNFGIPKSYKIFSYLSLHNYLLSLNTKK